MSSSCVVLGWLACFTLVVSLRFMLDDLSPLVLKCSPLLSGRDLSLSFSQSCACGPASGLLEEARTGGAAEPAVWREPARRVGNAGESSLTTPGARGQARLRKAVGSRRRDLPTVAPRGRG